jgi:hypothetical protein
MTNLVFEPSQTTHWKNLFPSKMLLLGSHNLNDGEELIAEIESVDVQDIRSSSGQMEQVPVARFVNAPPMVLNITNTRAIASLYGDQYGDWVGKSIQIYAVNVRAFGSEQMALRVREAIPDTKQDVSQYEAAILAAETMQELQKAFMGIPKHIKPRLVAAKDQQKEALNAQA